jgi:hypothetical protein
MTYRSSLAIASRATKAWWALDPSGDPVTTSALSGSGDGY